MKEKKESEKSQNKQQKIADLRALMCGDWQTAVPVALMELLGYDINELYCEICKDEDGNPRRIRPRPFDHFGVMCIKGCYVFENRNSFMFFVCCKKRTKKPKRNCKLVGVRALAQEGFLEDVDEIYERILREQEEEEEEDDDYDEEPADE